MQARRRIRSRSGKIGCGTWLLALVLVAAILSLVRLPRRDMAGPTNPDPAVPDRVKPWATLRVGDVARLNLPGATGVWIALDESAWNDMIDAENQGAKGGPGAGSAIFRLAEAKKVRKYPVGTKVRILRMGFTSRQVEILGGEDAGDRGWVQMEFVAP